MDNGDTDTATDGLGFDPSLLKDFGFFKKIGDGSGSAADGPWRLICIARMFMASRTTGGGTRTLSVMAAPAPRGGRQASCIDVW